MDTRPYKYTFAQVCDIVFEGYSNYVKYEILKMSNEDEKKLTFADKFK